MDEILAESHFSQNLIIIISFIIFFIILTKVLKKALLLINIWK